MRKSQSYEVIVHQEDAINSAENQCRIAKWYEKLIADTLQEANISLEEKIELLKSIP